jgi:glycosyltransferase involved in cell wall biosynthesis
VPETAPQTHEVSIAAGTRLAVVGLSVNTTCGVRDHATLLAAELEREAVACSMHWLTRTDRTLSGSRREVGEWARGLRRELAQERPDGVILHYSTFSYAHRGVPIFVPQVLAAVRGACAGAPLVGILHEIVYRWNFGGLRGKAWALTQRAALVDVMRTLDAAVLTAEERIGWLRSRIYLAHRPLLLAPVFSNLPAPRSAPLARTIPLVGLFGYAYQGAAIRQVLDGLQALRERGVATELRLLGAPGPDSEAAQAWRAEAGSRGLDVSFSGRLPAQELADALGACDVLLFADGAGPTSRKGTLAGSLASGRPLVAFDGPQTWPELRDARALALAPASPGGLADTLAELLGSEDEREALGGRGAEFARTRMSLERTAGAVAEALQAAAGRARGRASAARV